MDARTYDSMAACGVGNGGTAAGGVAVITGKDDALDAMNRSRSLRTDTPQDNRSQMASATEQMIVGRVSLVSCFADAIIICVLGVVVLLMYLLGEPYHRGFFCDDDTIRYSYKTDTISSPVLISCSVCIPFFVVLICEMVAVKRERSKHSRRVAVGPCALPIHITGFFYIFTLFLFGLGAQQVIVDAGKNLVGRLRPHFLDVCKPLPSVATLCGNASLQGPPPNAGIFYVPFAPANPHAYITNFRCTGPKNMTREARLSFPSGHSSMSFYAAVFVVVFLWRRFHWRRRHRLQLAFVQLMLLMLAWMTALSRISDHKHHWSDVMGGAAIGSLVAVITVCTAIRRYPPKTEETENESTYIFADPTSHTVIVPTAPPTV